MVGKYLDAYDTGRTSVQRREIFERHDYWQSSKVNGRQDVFVKNSLEQIAMFRRHRQQQTHFPVNL